MKRFVIRTITIIVLCLFLASFAGTASAGCPDDSCGCITKSGTYLGDVTIGRCWSWSSLSCEYCGGDKQPAKKCNEKYKECNNQCKKGSCKGI